MASLVCACPITTENNLLDASRKELCTSKKIFEELNYIKTAKYHVLLNRLGELELRSNNLVEAVSYLRASQEYFVDRSPKSVFYIESISGQAHILRFQNDFDGAMALLKQAICISDENGIRCRTYRIAKDRYDQEHEKISICEGRRLLQMALESEDSNLAVCASLPIEYLSFASNAWADRIGNGGFGAVFKGRDTVANFTFAIKTILPDRLDNEERAKFKKEIEVRLSKLIFQLAYTMNIEVVIISTPPQYHSCFRIL